MNATYLPELQQSVSLEYILLGDLRDLLEEQADEQTARWMSAVLDALLDALPREIVLRSRDGYLSEVLEEFPNWSPQVEKLRREKIALYRKLRDLRQGLGHPQQYAVVAGQLREDLREWMASFVAHHRHERRVVQSAFTLDVGCGD